MALELVRIYLVLLAIPALFAFTAWFAYRRYRLPGLAVLWAASSILYGYLSFLGLCGRPLTCDVGSDPFSLYYLSHVAPPFALAAAFAFGVISGVIVWRARRAGATHSRGRDLVWSTAAGVAAFVLVAPVVRAAIW